jgi:hypothetical protein
MHPRYVEHTVGEPQPDCCAQHELLLSTGRTYLSAALVSQHVHDAVDEALLAGRVPAAEALARLCATTHKKQQEQQTQTSSSKIMLTGVAGTAFFLP